ncbi:hypothetical protein PF005_g1582 [Phytophthora fragariae]|uniref:Dynein light chain n=2 Tax=Phytophthora TaxID=4783 RepID=A0A6A3MNG6_9STRA|nr:hypothetical protein PF003_g19867 [Phytophthora fragariae]KAE9042360.1 hypothetical protein PR002_g3967 [Phytophthora rubi]KAE8948830.1 hypothetical protein PF009_g1606 [Phytophthora fragariae]KAE9029543.1 hypothetical protein PF011_g1031 [Phytophthora fragariae]KAE9047879.1 hypothetical protein PR001_g4028 [Phytophthora rubi]
MTRENGKQMETDMDEHGDMKNDALAQASVALEQFTQEKEIAKHIKTWMEEKYGPTWHCIVGSEYKTAFTYESKNFVRFNVGKKCITLFRHP